ncbi:MAG: efflux transporter outer membrane subunit [Burkholderiales bacterium]
MTARALASLVALALVAGCATPGDVGPKSKPIDPAALKANLTLAADPAAPGAWPVDQWWSRFGDPQLDALVGEALGSSPSMRLARARVDHALALARVVGAEGAPQLDASLGTERQRITENGIFPRPIAGAWIWQNQATLDFSYDFDFWGRHRAAHDAAIGLARAAQADAQAARLVLASAIAGTYVALADRYEQLDLAREELALREREAGIVRRRTDAGLESRVELNQAEGSIPEVRQRMVQIEESIALARNQLAALLGQGPDRGQQIARPALNAGAAAALPANLPADLLGRRPDIVASRWRVEAAASDVSSARAAFYPNVNLVASLGLQAITWTHFLEPGSLAVGVGPAVSLPLFDGGRLRGQLGEKSADFDAAAEQYNQALADALREVADQVAAWRSIERQQPLVEAALASAETAHGYALSRYRAGLSNYTTVLSTESQLTAARSRAAELRTRRLEAAIGLARALGGGYLEGS